MIYFAYGSNLNKQQMKRRCPHAQHLGKAVLKDWQLTFQKSSTGFYCNIVPCEGAKTPIGLWYIPDSELAILDRYEGYPTCYGREKVKAYEMTGKVGRPPVWHGVLYRMPEDRPYGFPTKKYIRTCLEGYKDFGMDSECIDRAILYSYTHGARRNKRKPKKTNRIDWSQMELVKGGA